MDGTALLRCVSLWWYPGGACSCIWGRLGDGLDALWSVLASAEPNQLSLSGLLFASQPVQTILWWWTSSETGLKCAWPFKAEAPKIIISSRMLHPVGQSKSHACPGAWGWETYSLHWGRCYQGTLQSMHDRERGRDLRLFLQSIYHTI